MGKSQASHDVTLVDAASLFDACESIAGRLNSQRITLNYSKLRERLDACRRQAGWHPASLSAIVLSVDPQSEGQQRFQSMLRHAGFEPDLVHFRDAFVSLPPGRTPGDVDAKSTISLAARIAYIAGLMARHPTAHFLVATHSFELCGPLTDLAQRMPQGRIGLAYFESLLDYRWRTAGLFDETNRLKIEFFDLDEHGEELMGVRLIPERNEPSEGMSSLSRY